MHHSSWKPKAAATTALFIFLAFTQPGLADATADVQAARQAIAKHDYQTALKLVMPLAQANDPAAECLLGEIYEFGYGVPQDSAEALKWYKSAARGEHKHRYSVHLALHEAIPTDPKELKRYVDDVKAHAQSGDPDAQFVLGTLYFKGLGVKRDFAQSFNWFEKSSAQGNSDATNDLGFMYQHGAHVKQDYAKAAELYQKAAAAGSTAAQNNLGFLYANGLGVEGNVRRAVQLFTSASNNGNFEAMTNLGWMYQKGLGVDRDYRTAVALYAKAAAHGVPAAQYNLGYMYQYGLGVNRQQAKAVKLYTLAAAAGYPGGQNALGFMYEHGTGVPQDYQLALKWYKKEAERKAYSYKLPPNFDIYD